MNPNCATINPTDPRSIRRHYLPWRFRYINTTLLATRKTRTSSQGLPGTLLSSCYRARKLGRIRVFTVNPRWLLSRWNDTRQTLKWIQLGNMLLVLAHSDPAEGTSNTPIASYSYFLDKMTVALDCKELGFYRWLQPCCLTMNWPIPSTHQTVEEQYRSGYSLTPSDSGPMIVATLMNGHLVSVYWVVLLNPTKYGFLLRAFCWKTRPNIRVEWLLRFLPALE